MSDEPQAPAPSPAAEVPAAPRRAVGAGRTESVKNPWPFFLLVAVLIGAGWLIVSWMSDTSQIQDCVMSGRKNCAPVDPKLGR